MALAYRRYLATADTPVFAADVDRHYSPATLCGLLRRGDRELRQAAALALGMVGDQATIDALGRSLADPDRGVRLAADDSFRGLLVRSAAPCHLQRLLQVMHLNDGGEFGAALTPAVILADQAPRYAEAHHQLAICRIGLDDAARAEAAYRKCLWHCRYHYLGWQGLAQVRLARGDRRGAERGLERCLDICPDMESARIQLRSLRRYRRQSDV